LSPRGKVLENGMPRFFRRLFERVFDLEDRRIDLVSLDFIQKCSVHYKFDLERTIAIGFSIEANMAMGIFFLRPELFQGAILIRAMFPFIPNSLPNLLNKRILLSAEIEDPIVPKTETENL
jgi:predicted esterase